MKKIKIKYVNCAYILLIATLTLCKRNDVDAFSKSNENSYTPSISTELTNISININIDEYNEDVYLKEKYIQDIKTNTFIKNDYLYGVEPIEKKEYSGMALDNELEDYIKEKCYEVIENNIYDVSLTEEDLFRIIMTLGEKESNGTWSCDGVISKTNDYGQFQINKCNHKDIYENLGYTSDDLLNDRYKNTDAAIYLICNNILTHPKCKSIEDVFGMYNGWSNWRNIKRSVKYSENCLNIMEEYFGTKEYVKELVR